MAKMRIFFSTIQKREKKKHPSYCSNCYLLQQLKQTNSATLESSFLERLFCKRKKS